MDPKYRTEHPGNDRDEQRARAERRRKYRLEWARLNDQRRRVYTPWLLIRYRTSDLGLRPIPAGEAHWVSPDIWVESSDPSGNAVAGEDNFVHARIFNLGKAAAVPTRVDFYWADPSLGLGPGSMNLIGTEWVGIEPHTALDVRCRTPWVPTFLNNGHECLMVNCTSQIVDPIAHPFEPRQDRHVGQRNITVVQAAAGEILPFFVLINNVFPLTVEMMIAARVERVRPDRAATRRLTPRDVANLVAAFGARAALEPAELRSLYRKGAPDYARAVRLSQFLQRASAADSAVRDVTNAFGGAPGAVSLKAAWTGDPYFGKPSQQAAQAANLLRAQDDLSPAGLAFDTYREFSLQRASFEAFEQRRLSLEIRVPPDAWIGEFVAIHLVERVTGILVGGYTVVMPVSRRSKDQKG